MGLSVCSTRAHLNSIPILLDVTNRTLTVQRVVDKNNPTSTIQKGARSDRLSSTKRYVRLDGTLEGATRHAGPL